MKHPPATQQVEKPLTAPHATQTPHLCWKNLSAARQRELSNALTAMLVKKLPEEYQRGKEARRE
jgi:hypothetical protein